MRSAQFTKRLLQGSLAVLTAAAWAPMAASAEGLRTAATFPPGTFLESIAVTDDDTAIITSYYDREVISFAPDDAVSILAELDVNPVGILRIDEGFVVSAHGAPFTDGPAFMERQELVFLDENGLVGSRILLPDALFLNGLERLNETTVLVADSLAATIWAVDTEAMQVSLWLQHELLSPLPAQAVARPGANGLKVRDDILLVSNSSRGALYGIALSSPADSRVPELIAETGPIDDFAVLGDGTIVYSSHGDTIGTVSGEGVVGVLFEEGCNGCTAIMERRRSRELLAVTTGGLLEGQGLPAEVLVFDIPAN